MKGLIFIGSYAVGFVSLFVGAESYLFYLFGLFMYLALTNVVKENSHRYVVIDPLILSSFSVLLISLMEGRPGMPFLTFMSISIFLTIFHQLKGKMTKLQKEKEAVNVHYYFKRLLLPCVFPVGFYFVGLMFIEVVASSYIYWMFYFLVIIYFAEYIATKFFLFYFLFNQIVINLYLFQYMDELMPLEKVMAIGMVAVACWISYLHQRIKGGNVNLPLIQTVPRKQIQKPENRPMLLERR